MISRSFSFSSWRKLRNNLNFLNSFKAIKLRLKLGSNGEKSLKYTQTK